MTVIEDFRGKYWFLSNFYPISVEFEGRLYPSAEHAYQAAKTDDPAIREGFTYPHLSGGAAKRMGRLIKLSPDWDRKKISVMVRVVAAKFTGNSVMGMHLRDTWNQTLIEGNNWGDTFWGVDPKQTKNAPNGGQNWLGRILMATRRALTEGIRDYAGVVSYVEGELGIEAKWPR